MNMGFVTMIMMLPNSLKEKNLLSWQLINSSHTKMWNWRSSLRANPLYPLIAYIGHGLIDPRWYETAILFKPAVQWNKGALTILSDFTYEGSGKCQFFCISLCYISTNLKSHIYSSSVWSLLILIPTLSLTYEKFAVTCGTMKWCFWLHISQNLYIGFLVPLTWRPKQEVNNWNKKQNWRNLYLSKIKTCKWLQVM